MNDNRNKDAIIREVPPDVSYFKLNSDGTYQDAAPGNTSIYIDESQVFRIWDPEVAKYIREHYGPFVGVMHNVVTRVLPPVGQSMMYVLGA